MTHTPGPWKIYNAYELVGKPGMICALRIASKDKTVIEPAQYDTDLKMSEADARLIAAAPKLLAALQEMVAEAFLQDPFSDEEGERILKNAYSVIADAEGEEPA